MSNSQYINICFSNMDKELIAWANMIRDNDQSINTWVQAILLAEAVGENLDAGSVYVPKNKPKPVTAGSLMFGDDRKSAKNKKKPASGWQVRGENGEIVAGSILSIRVTRPVMIALLDHLRRSHKRLGPYVKAVLRKRIRKLDSGPHIPPDASHVQDIFALYEDRYMTDACQQPQTIPPAQRRDGPPQQTLNPDKNSMPAERNLPLRDNRPCQQNRNHKDSQPQQQKQPTQKTSPKTKHPLLGYIN